NMRSQIDFQTPMVLDSTASSRANLSVHLHSKTCLVFSCRYSIVKELSEISNLKFGISISTKRRNFNPQSLFRVRVQVSNHINRQSPIANRQCIGGGEGIRTPDPRVANAVLCQLSYTPDKFETSNFRSELSEDWLRGRDLNPRPLGYEPNELPDCSTPRQT